MLTAKEIRRRYLEFFKRHQHEIVESGPIIPPNDPTLLFTNAGMVQFKKLFLGEEKRAYSRATTCQKCLRVSGKHNDLENVGRTARHHTFFEMLGNFSFGDYFKREAITWAWEFVAKELELPKEKLWVTVFREDDEAAAIWAEVAGLPADRIVRMGEKDNFWTMGDTGPCGPCSEIYVDQGEDMSCGPDCGIGKCDCDRFLEIWNLVFTQFDQSADGTRVPLANPNIDTGMGLERMAAVAQGKRSNFDCDLFQEIIQYAASLANVSYSFSAPDTNDVDTALRVIADHSRSAAFLVAGGVLPSNEGRGYVLRRLIRRALRFATLIGVNEPFMYKVARKVTEVMGDAYPELIEHADFIARAVHEEEQRFSLTLQKGLELLDEELASLKAAGQTRIPGEFCFKLYDTYGFPLDIVTDVAEKRSFTADDRGFETHMAEQRKRARDHQKKGGLLGQADGANVFKPLLDAGVTSTFVGYERLTEKSPLTLLLNAAGEEVADLGEGETGYAITAATPFYGEGGGQAGDMGTLASPSGEAGAFMIVSESGVAAGTRRIEAVTGWNAYAQAMEQRAELAALSGMLKARPGQLAERVAALQGDVKKLRKASEKAAAAPATGADLAARAQDVNGVRMLAAKLDNVPVKALREVMDDVRSRLSDKSVVCLATAEDGKVGLLLYVSKDLHGKFTAPALIKDVAAPCGGSGGGRPDLAQAGGTKADGIDEAFAVLKQRIEQ